MNNLKLGVIEARFADIIWENQPLCSADLVKLAAQELNWKKSTTYTVLKRLIQRGIFQNQNGVVSALIPRDEYFAAQGEQFIEETFQGSLPAFLAAFTARKKLTAEEIEQLQTIIDQMRR